MRLSIHSQNFSSATVKKLVMNKLFHSTLYWACVYLSMLILKSNHVSTSGPRCQEQRKAGTTGGAIVDPIYEKVSPYLYKNYGLYNFHSAKSSSCKEQYLHIIHETRCKKATKTQPVRFWAGLPNETKLINLVQQLHQGTPCDKRLMTFS